METRAGDGAASAAEADVDAAVVTSPATETRAGDGAASVAEGDVDAAVVRAAAHTAAREALGATGWSVPSAPIGTCTELLVAETLQPESLVAMLHAFAPRLETLVDLTRLRPWGAPSIKAAAAVLNAVTRWKSARDDPDVLLDARTAELFAAFEASDKYSALQSGVAELPDRFYKCECCDMSSVVCPRCKARSGGVTVADEAITSCATAVLGALVAAGFSCRNTGTALAVFHHLSEILKHESFPALARMQDAFAASGTLIMLVGVLDKAAPFAQIATAALDTATRLSGTGKAACLAQLEAACSQEALSLACRKNVNELLLCQGCEVTTWLCLECNDVQSHAYCWRPSHEPTSDLSSSSSDSESDDDL